LSVFNISQALVANANNNNNNNNINDNKLNANENDINEGNANSEVMAMNMIMRKRSLYSYYPVEVKTKSLHNLQKRPISDVAGAKNATIIMTFLKLWMSMLAANSKDCQRLHFCQVNDQVSSQSRHHWELAEICSLGVAKYAAKNHFNDLNQLLLAGKYGRQGLNCTQIYDECSLNELRFIEFAQLLPWSPVGELKFVRNLVSWMLNK
jgi:hypothetical protein